MMEPSNGDRLAPLWLMALTTGLRRGELAGLRGSDIDLAAGKLTVSVARVVVGYKVVDSGPKTPKGKRTIAVAASVIDALKVHRARQVKERDDWGKRWDVTGLVFTKENGDPYHP